MMFKVNPIVSIIMPVYNGETFIENSIQSVLDQTFTEWELIVVDDGSVDNSRKLITKFSDIDYRIRYFYQKNSGRPAVPKNLGISHALGYYLCFLDQDDIYHPPESVKKQFTNSSPIRLTYWY